MKDNYVGIAIEIYVIVAVFLFFAKSEFFTSISELEQLVLCENEIVKSLQNYIRTEEERLHKLRRFSQLYGKLYRTASIDTEVFLSSPINAFLLVKHLTEDWKVAINLIRSSENQTLIDHTTLQKMVLPDTEDLSGAAISLLRLQKTYLIDTEIIAQGRIKGANFSLELTASDCFELGRQALQANSSQYALLWMEESLKRLDKEKVPTADIVDIMEFLASAAYNVGNFSYGLTVLENIINIDPNSPRISASVQYYLLKKDQWDNKEVLDENQVHDEDTSEYIIEIDGKLWPEHLIMDQYDKLCRGETVKNPRKELELYCYYTTNDNHYLLLQPIKVEVLNQNPQIVLFHDVIKDSESKIIKEMSAPKLLRALVQDTFTGEIEVSMDRISKSAIFYDAEHEVFARLSRRIQDITGLAIESAEPMTTINYGIGGHYDPHWDYLEPSDKVDLYRQLRNRIATWIFYLTDVPAGGSTVFPFVDVEVKPIKGAAIFWYNLFKNGEGDLRTLHAACPVLVGSKWVSTKWLHEIGQEFRKPCSLDETA